jgi:hypothetical protein
LTLSKAFYKVYSDEEATMPNRRRGDMLSSMAYGVKKVTDAISEAIEDLDVGTAFEAVKETGTFSLEAGKGVPATRIANTLELIVDLIATGFEDSGEKIGTWMSGGEKKKKKSIR